MRKLIINVLLIATVVTLTSVVESADRPRTYPNNHMIQVSILDCTDVGNTAWKQALILERQAMSLLHSGDEFILIGAHKDRNTIEINCSIDANNAAQQTVLNHTLMAMEYEWWCRANLANALQLAYDKLTIQAGKLKCCILISDGQCNDSDVEKIRNKAALCKLNDIKLLIIVKNTANQNLLAAGNKGEFSLMTLDNADLKSWLETIRPHPATKIADTLPTPNQSTPLTPPPVEPPKQELPTTPPEQPKKTKPQPDKTTPSETPPIIASPPLPSPPAPAPPKRVPEPTRHDKTWWSLSGWTLWITLSIVIAIICVALMLRKPSQDKSIANETSDQDPQAMHQFVAVVEDVDYPLGEKQTISKLLFGSNPGSVVPLMGDNIKDKLFEIERTDSMFEIRNLDTEELYISGMPLASGETTELILPARVQTKSGPMIGFYLEDPASQIPTDNSDIEGVIDHAN